MSFSSLFKKASSFLGLGSPEHLSPPPLDGEIIYCKNNVCVHPPAMLSSDVEHFPGYLNIRSQEDQVLGSTLILTWIPNSTLKRNPRSIENSPNKANGVSPRRSPGPKQEFSKTSHPSTCQSPTDSEWSDLGRSIESQTEYTSRDASQEMLCSSLKSQTDSGIDPGELGEAARNNTKAVGGGDRDKVAKSSKIGTNVNELYNKQNNVKQNNVDRIRLGGSDAESPPPGNVSSGHSLHKAKLKDTAKERNSSNGSNRSVTSIEMEGDSLVVVTEEVDDTAFLDNDSPTSGHGESAESASMSSDSTYPSPTSERYHKMLSELVGQQEKQPDGATVDKDVEQLKGKMELDLDLNAQPIPTSVLTPASMSSSSTSTSGPDSSPATPSSLHQSPSHVCGGTGEMAAEASYNGELFEVHHNMSFPHNSISYSPIPAGGQKKTAKEQVCGVFSVDLGQMRSLRIFYTDNQCSSGQLVIASRESQYKILHFHHGGLDRLVEVFSEWKFLAQPKDRRKKDMDLHCKHFSVIRPHLTEEQCHPEEGAFEMVNEETWHQHMNTMGQIEDDYTVRKAIFFAGLDPSLRHEMWPFLLHYYPYSSTYDEREAIRNDKFIAYQNLRKKRESMSEEEKETFWKNIQCTVEKDVVRTDRSHPYFKGADNPNIEVLKHILLNYAVAHPHYGYTQGMSDLLAPVLAEVQKEADAYWCFVGLMQKTIFVSSPKDVDMDKQLIYLRELLKLMLPKFYHHLYKVEDGMELLFCHRWILLCFKREFPEEDALRMWEACWAHYQSDYFHLFICVAIISVYGEDVLQQDLPSDEMLLHFSSLSLHMSGDVVLRKARGLMHQFRLLPRIPCTLHDLCTLCGPGIWDSGHVPAVECRGDHDDDLCPFGGKVFKTDSSPSKSK